MKLLFTIAFIVATTCQAAELFRVEVEGKFGYINRNGVVVISPRDWVALSFSEGLAYVCIEQTHQFINSAGNVAFDVTFPEGISHAGYFSEGVCPVYTPFGVRYINRLGKPIFEKIFEKGYAFSDGLAAVKDNGAWGFINTNGEFVVRNEYDSAFPFSDGLAHVKRQGVWGIINTNGNILVEPQYPVTVPTPTEGISVVAEKGKWYFVDASGRKVLANGYDAALCFRQGLAPVMITKKWGYINTSGQLVIPATYESANEFSEDRAKVQIHGKYGFIDTTGRIVVEPRYEYAKCFKNGLAEVGNDSMMGYVDRFGKEIWWSPSEEREEKDSQGKAE